MSKYTIFYIEAILLFALPVALLTYSSQFLAVRHIFMAVAGIYSAWRLFKYKATLSSLGIHRTNFVASLKDLVNPSLFMILVTFAIFIFTPAGLMQTLIGYDSLPPINLVGRLIMYITLSAPIQELIFRGYITWRIKEVYTKRSEIIMLSVAFFTFAHLPFHSILFIVLTGFMGYIFIKNYLKYQNLYTMMIAHALVGGFIFAIRYLMFPF